MPQIRDVLVHVCVETAKGRRKCYRNKKHSIQKNEQCLVVKTGSIGSKHNYCRECAQKILDRAGDRLAEIVDALE